MKTKILCTIFALGISAPVIAFGASNDNEAYVYQDPYSYLNYAEIYQEYGSNRNLGTIQQVGEVNDAVITQEYSHDSSAEIYQDGVGNIADIQQLDGANFATALIDQALDGNEAYILQEFSKGSWAEVVQLGYDNVAEVVQGSFNPGVGNNYAFVEMTGDGDYVNIDQAFSTNGSAEAFTEGGGGNEIWILQDGNGNSAVANVWGYGSTGNILEIDQYGRNNQATAESGYLWDDTSSFITIIQDGRNNIAYAASDGGGFNDIWVEQVGVGNDAWAIVEGFDNIVTISQFDRNNVAMSETVGDSNTVNIYQGGF